MRYLQYLFTVINSKQYPISFNVTLITKEFNYYYYSYRSIIFGYASILQHASLGFFTPLGVLQILLCFHHLVLLYSL